MRCILLHPHPDMGGTQHNAVIAALAAALDDAVRFDFASADPAVATAQVLERLDAGPAWLVGYSFGGGIAALADDPRVLGWCLIAPALAMVDPVIGADPRPKHVLACERDAFFSPASLREATAGWAATTHDVIAGADHFLAGREADVAARCAAWLRSHVRATPAPLGVCVDDADEAAAFAGTADFVELSGRDLVRATDDVLRDWTRHATAYASAPVCNRLLPYGITLHDTPDNRARLDAHWTALLQRGAALGVAGYCLGGSVARAVDDGPGRVTAIAGVRRVIAELAQRTADAGATLHLEPLRPAECGWLNRAADGAAIGPAGVLGLCADIVHLADEAGGETWPDAVAWARSAHCHVSGPDHGALDGHAREAAAFVAAVGRGVHVERTSLEHFGGTVAQRCGELEALRAALTG